MRTAPYYLFTHRAAELMLRDDRFLLSTHYTNYNPWLFAINLSALILVLIPKLPIVRFGPPHVLFLTNGLLLVPPLFIPEYTETVTSWRHVCMLRLTVTV